MAVRWKKSTAGTRHPRPAQRVALSWKPCHCMFTSGSVLFVMLVHDRDVAMRPCGINILNQSTVGATGSHAWGQSVRPDIAAAIGQRWMNQEANLL